jgi:hypothetical protein
MLIVRGFSLVIGYKVKLKPHPQITLQRRELYIVNNHDCDVYQMRFCIQQLLQLEFAIYGGISGLLEMVTALSFAYIWQFQNIFDQEDLIM